MQAVSALDNLSALGGLRLSLWALVVLAGVFFLTSAVSMVTGSTSLITVPALFQAGVEPQMAIATNMAALTLMSLGAFLGGRVVLRLSNRWLRRIYGITVIALALNLLLRP